MEVTIYHNPRCSKSRQALALLEQRGVRLRVIEYLKTPPTQPELEHILALLGLDPRALMRQKEAEYTTEKLHNPELSHEALIRAMIKTPKLIERPIVLANGRAVIGRPPEAVLEIL